MKYVEELSDFEQRQSIVSRDYIPAIDGLRAISILLVLIYHINKSVIPGGFVGVDVFFVVSGFVVAKSVDGANFGSLQGFLANFYRRRMVRIAPALLFFVLLFTLLSVLLTPIGGGERVTDAIGLSSFFGLSNFALWWFEGDYFSAGPGFNPFTHTWSLAVEEQFYLLFPLLAFFLFVSGGGRTTRSARWAVAVLSVTVLTSLALVTVLSATAPSLAFYMLPTRLWELGCGVLLYRVLSQPGTRGRAAALKAVAAPLGLVLASGLVALIALEADPAHFPFPWAVPAVAFALVVLSAVTLWPQSVLAQILATPPLVQLGRLSYSLYLAHFGVVVLFRWTIGLESAASQIAAAVLSLLLAVVSYTLIESPLRHSPGISRRADVTVLLAGFCTLLAASAVAAATFHMRPQITLSRTGDRAVWAPYVEASSTVVDCRVAYDREEFHGGHFLRFAPAGCPAPGAVTHIVAIGDSHAWAYGKMFRATAARLGAVVESYQRPGCSLYKFWVTKPNSDAGPCADFRRNVLAEFAARAAPGDILFLPALRMERFQNGFGAPVLENADLDLVFGHADIAESKAVRVELAPLLKAGIRVIVEAPKPVFRADPYRCADWFTANNPLCAPGFEVPRKTLETRRSRTLRTLDYFASLAPGISVWDPFPILCPGETCSAFDGDWPLFYDADHLSGYGNKVLLPSFLDHLAGLERG